MKLKPCVEAIQLLLWLEGAIFVALILARLAFGALDAHAWRLEALSVAGDLTRCVQKVDMFERRPAWRTGVHK